MSNELKFWQVDAFTDQPFKGNPAAVFVLDHELPDELMQSIAVEMNLSETVFVLTGEVADPLLRWFTPTMEIDLCGHATLASAHVVLSYITPSANQIKFDTKFVGPLQVEKTNDGYRMDFPSRPGEPVDVQDIPNFVTKALGGIRPIEAFKARDLMLVYDNEDVIHDMKPDFNALKHYNDFIIVTAQSSGQPYDFVSRFFCADDGIVEDPVTGSAHCTSAPYWGRNLDKTKLRAYQASARGGHLELELTDDRVLISGKAVTVIEGKLIV